jgi:hypothetical protein
MVTSAQAAIVFLVMALPGEQELREAKLQMTGRPPRVATVHRLRPGDTGELERQPRRRRSGAPRAADSEAVTRITPYERMLK